MDTFPPSSTRIPLFDEDGEFVREIGKGVYGIAYAHQVRFDDEDNLWVADKAANTVIRFDPDGYVTMNFSCATTFPHPCETDP